MDKIRDILFGNQARDYDKRFSRMESQLNREAAELRQELLKRVDTLESYIKQEIKDINARIKNENNERAEGDAQLQKDLKEMFETLSKKLHQEEENLAERSADLREQILEQSKQLSDEISTKHEQATQSLKQAAMELDDAKMNRADLSGFLLDIAMRISGDELGVMSAARD
jgi:DNA repair exonuclease SbcCD ATPase subunit